jgi:hypothetical protein
MGVQETILDVESKDGTGSGGDDMDQLRDKNFTRKRGGDLHDLVHILTKRCKVHVPAVTYFRRTLMFDVTCATIAQCHSS